MCKTSPWWTGCSTPVWKPSFLHLHQQTKWPLDVSKDVNEAGQSSVLSIPNRCLLFSCRTKNSLPEMKTLPTHITSPSESLFSFLSMSWRFVHWFFPLLWVMKINLQELANPFYWEQPNSKGFCRDPSVPGSEEIRKVNVDVLGFSPGFI